jgi:hypothetical protein
VPAALVLKPTGQLEHTVFVVAVQAAVVLRPEAHTVHVAQGWMPSAL